MTCDPLGATDESASESGEHYDRIDLPNVLLSMSILYISDQRAVKPKVKPDRWRKWERSTRK